MTRARILASLGVIVPLMLAASTAHAQLETFATAVRDLAAASALPEPARAAGIGAAASRMGSALVAWDRNLRLLADRVEREGAGDAGPRAYQLHLELAVAYRARGRY